VQQGLQVKPDEAGLKEAVVKATGRLQMQRHCMFLSSVEMFLLAASRAQKNPGYLKSPT